MGSTAGIVFLPKATQVDATTGSKYQLDEHEQPILAQQGDDLPPTLQIATETIASQDYWEMYFSQHPDERPSRVIYYEGAPSKALQTWVGSLGITWQTPQIPVQEVFADHKVTRDSALAQTGLAEFTKLAQQVITEHFASQDPSDTTSYILSELAKGFTPDSLSKLFGFDSWHDQNGPLAKLTEEGYFTFDTLEQAATLTDRGRQFLIQHGSRVGLN